MILVDFNGLAVASIMGVSYGRNAPPLDEELVRSVVLNALRLIRNKFTEKYGELVIAIDSPDTWRKSVFPYYKASRKKSREASGVDWHIIYGALKAVVEELKMYFPYKILQIEHTEADDIIGVLCQKLGSLGLRHAGDESILIVSNDQDFLQLQKYANVDQWAPVKKKMLVTNNPERTLREHIMRGDQGDGVPNFLSPDNVYVTEGLRSSKLMTEKVDRWAEMEPDEFCTEEMLRGYKRNQMLIDLDHIPQTYKDAIWEQFDNYVPKDRSRLLTYFTKYRLRNLVENITEF